jgi:hypothetical protein
MEMEKKIITRDILRMTITKIPDPQPKSHIQNPISIYKNEKESESVDLFVVVVIIKKINTRYKITQQARFLSNA